MTERINVFISYSHKDKSSCAELLMHMGALRYEGIIDVWTDGDILPGSDWSQEITKALEKSDVILLLISASFISSEFCYSVEMKRAVERHQVGDATVIPIILADCYWESAPFARFQALPKGLMALSSVPSKKRSAVYREIVAAIHSAVHALAERKRQLAKTGAPEPDRKSSLRSIEERLEDLKVFLASALFQTSATGDALNAACGRHGVDVIVRAGETQHDAVNRLMALQFQTGLEILQDAHKALKGREVGGSQSAAATAIRTLARGLVPYLFVSCQNMDNTREKWERIEERQVISIRAGHETFAEIVAAGLDLREIKYSEKIKDIDSWPKGFHNVNDPPPAGIYAKHEDESNIRKHLWAKVNPPRPPGKATSQQIDSAINNQLTSFAEKRGIRYYVIYNDNSDSYDEDIAVRWQKLIYKNYPALVFIGLDPELYSIHQGLFNDLRDILDT